MSIFCRLFHSLKLESMERDRWEYYYSLFVTSYFYQKPVSKIQEFDSSDSKEDLFILSNILQVDIDFCFKGTASSRAEH